MSEKKEIKVTDKRMFTADGELREDYRHLASEDAERPEEIAEKLPSGEPAASQAPPGGPAADRTPSGEAAAGRGSAPAEPVAGGGEGASAGGSPRLEIPGTPPGMGAPGFMDLVGVLTDPILVYLGDAKLPDGSTAENLDMARLHIDLLDVLREKTRGNVSAQETAMLEDLLYQLRMRYVRKRD